MLFFERDIAEVDLGFKMPADEGRDPSLSVCGRAGSGVVGVGGAGLGDFPGER